MGSAYQDDTRAFLNGLQDGLPVWGAVRQGFKGAVLASVGHALTREPDLIEEKNGGVSVTFRRGRVAPEDRERTEAIVSKHGAALKGLGVRTRAYGFLGLGAAGYNLYEAGTFATDLVRHGIAAASTRTHLRGMGEAFVTACCVSLLTAAWDKDARLWQAPIVRDLREWARLHPERPGAPVSEAPRARRGAARDRG
ncbi:MAG: hypothetical protein PW734_03350 [Verrucomicrobium sp.]|nr:hypothetical protein [Verrucomicrobium sp.]